MICTNTNDTALFTTVYPEGLKYLQDWYESIKYQSTQDFDICIGCDRLSPEETQSVIGTDIQAQWIIKNENESLIQFRERAMKKMVEKYSKIIFVDSDDILCPDRVKVAQDALEIHDVYGCSMQIIDEQGLALPIFFKSPKDIPFEDLILKNNIFGFTNAAYDTKTLINCMPFPKNAVLLDWFMITKAMLNGADLYFDNNIHMQYRQHSLNTARILPPFTKEQIIKSTELVIQNYELLFASIEKLDSTARPKLESNYRNAKAFRSFINSSVDKFNTYIEKLNKLPAKHIWWSCVAYKELEYLWKK